MTPTTNEIPDGEGSGGPYLVPLSFLWNGTTLLIATPASGPTGRNPQRSDRVRVGIGPTRDVVLIEGTVRCLVAADSAPDLGDMFAAKTGLAPRDLTTPYVYFRIFPQRIQAWREANELTGRELMRDGRWLIPD